MVCRTTDAAASTSYVLTKLLDIEGVETPKSILKNKKFKTLEEISKIIGEHGDFDIEKDYLDRGKVFHSEPFNGQHYIYIVLKENLDDITGAEWEKLEKLALKNKTVFLLEWSFQVIAKDEEGETIPDYVQDGKLEPRSFDTVERLSSFIKEDIRTEDNFGCEPLVYDSSRIDTSVPISVLCLDDSETGFIEEEIEDPDSVISIQLSLFPKKRIGGEKEASYLSTEEFKWLLDDIGAAM